MNFAADSRSGTRDAVTFVVCLLLAIAARADPLGVSPQVASALRETVLVPFIYLQRQTQDIRDRRATFARVMVERDSLAMVGNELRTVRAENTRLRTILGLSQRLRLRHVAAEVLPQVELSDMSTLVITAGARQGVQLWAPVIAPSGLVGYVYQVDRSTALVYAWTHGAFRASASAIDSSVTGLVAPRAGTGLITSMEFREVAYGANLVPGTPIVTTGLGGVYPRGLLIGTAGELVAEQAGLSKTYVINPAVYPAEVAHVLVLLPDFTPGVDLTELFVEPIR